MFDFTFMRKARAELLTRRLDRVLRNDANPTRTMFLQIRTLVLLQSQREGKTVKILDTYANTVREWIQTGYVFFEDGSSVPLNHFGITYPAAK